MAGMGNLRNVFELVIDGFDDRTFASQQLIHQGHQLVGHILADGGDELQPLFEELFKEALGQVAAIPAQLAPQLFGQTGTGLRSSHCQGSNKRPIIHLGHRQ